jgi:hypothetical protein
MKRYMNTVYVISSFSFTDIGAETETFQRTDSTSAGPRSVRLTCPPDFSSSRGGVETTVWTVYTELPLGAQLFVSAEFMQIGRPDR